MYTFYLAFVVSLVIIGLLVRRFRRTSATPICDSLLAACGTFVLLAIVAAITGLAVNANLPQKTVVGGPFDLAAIRSADGISGSFIYGTGSISGSVFYNVYVKNADGSMTPYQVAADSTARVVEDSGMHDRGTWMQTTVSYDYSSPWAHWAIGQDYKAYHNVFKVPAGTVVHGFSVK
jgi:hypothetical protein